MTTKPLLAACIALVLCGCGSDSAETTATAAGSDSANMEQAGLPGSDARREALVISPRTYTSGTVKAKVTGFFQVDGSQTLNLPASLTDEDHTWLQYGVSGGPGLDVLFTNSTAMAEHGVTIGLGPHSVTTVSTNGECRAKVDVTPTRVTGHYSCTGLTGYNDKTGEMGKVDVEVEFSAGS